MSLDIRQLKVTRSAQLRITCVHETKIVPRTHTLATFGGKLSGWKFASETDAPSEISVILPGLETFVLGSWRGSFLKLGRLVAK